MRALFKKQILIPLILAVLAGSVIAIWFLSKEAPVEPVDRAPAYQVIGTSVEGRPIEAFNFLPARSLPVRGTQTGTQAGGDGDRHLLFVGGIHGGYEWNSVVLSYQFMDYLEAHAEIIPENLTVTVIPSANPDGVYKVVGTEGRFTRADVSEELEAGLGRFNANDVDLNRNFDCKWQPESTWQDNIVSAGLAPFSEPESRTIRDFILEYEPDAVIFWHSQSNAVYASECEDGILPETLAIMNVYSRASGYPAVESFDHYEITGDAEGWLASIGIPAITVELSTHETIEWEKNLAGIKTLFDYYSENSQLSR